MSFCLPCALLSCGFHSRAWQLSFLVGFRIISPMQFHLCSLISFAVGMFAFFMQISVWEGVRICLLLNNFSFFINCHVKNANFRFIGNRRGRRILILIFILKLETFMTSLFLSRLCRTSRQSFFFLFCMFERLVAVVNTALKTNLLPTY